MILADVQSVIAGRFQLHVEESHEADPFPALLQITSADVSEERIRSTCSPGGGGCATVISRQGPFLMSVRAIQRTGTTLRLKVHELGHAVGLCHVSGAGMPTAVMANPPGVSAVGRFSDLELQAIRAVYESPLEPGATRSDFQRVGLIR